MTIGNRYELLDAQRYIGQDVLNVYYYKQIGGLGGDAETLVGLFQSFILPAILTIQNDQLTHISLACRNLDDPMDFFVQVFLVPQAGTWLDPGGPPFIAASFMYHRAQLNVRNGWKRFAGVPNDQIDGGTPSASYATACAGIVDDLFANPVDGAQNVWTPLIMRKTYDPLTGITTYTDFPVASVSFRGISTQNTRKIGRGS